MMERVRWIAPWLLTAALGCSHQVPLAPVKGKVLLDDKPLATGTIRFESQGQRPATAQIRAGEIVEVSTYRTGDGVPLGAHQIAVWSSDEADSAVVANPGEGKIGANYMSGKSRIPARYNDPASSGLRAEIKAGENVLEFRISSKP